MAPANGTSDSELSRPQHIVENVRYNRNQVSGVTSPTQVQVQLRQSLPAPTHPDVAATISLLPSGLRVHHPAYPQGKSQLFRMPASDTPRGGLHHETVRVACAIVANNRFDGYLSLFKAAGNPVSQATDDVLTARDYYFHVPGDSDYPIVPSFEHWRFPHTLLPPSWSHGSNEEATISGPDVGPVDVVSGGLTGNVRCCISSQIEAIQVSYLCHPSEKTWFINNDMDIYNSNSMSTPPLHPANALFLRADLRMLFDQKRLFFTPKCGSFVVHVLAPSTEMLRLYHNTVVTGLSGVAVEYLFARFAWTIFGLLKSGFLSLDMNRTLIIVNEQNKQQRLLRDSSVPFTISSPSLEPGPPEESRKRRREASSVAGQDL